MKLHLFNPENDLAIADGNANYCAPPSALKIAYDLSTLPLWYANNEDAERENATRQPRTYDA